MTDKELRKLAELSIRDGEVKGTVAEFVLNSLSKANLKKYLTYLNILLNQERIYVTIAESFEDIEQKIKDVFKGKTVMIEVDKSLGAGARIKTNDMIIDTSIKYYIENTAAKIKEEL